MDDVENRLREIASGETVSTPRVQLIYTISDDLGPVESTRVSARIQNMDKRVFPNLGDVEYDMASSSFILPMTSQVDYMEVDVLKGKIDAVMRDEGFDVVAVTLDASIEERVI